MSDPAAGTTAHCQYLSLHVGGCWDQPSVISSKLGPEVGGRPGALACSARGFTPSHRSDSCFLLSPRRNPAEEGAGYGGAEEGKGVWAKGAQGLPGPGIRCVPPQEDGRGSV